MSAKRRKTILRTIRLTKELDDVLQEDAEANGISVSALINRIIKKHAEWDRH
nr:ribbon-helix-helix protein, CopG family [Candidatus Njordarchaeota archaeon]